MDGPPILGALVCLGLFLAAPRARADAATFFFSNIILSGLLTRTCIGLTAATAYNEGQPEPNRALAWTSVGFGTLGIVSGAIGTVVGAWTYSQKPGSDDTVDFQHGMGWMYMGPGIASLAMGLVTVGYSIHDGLRESRIPPELSKPVVLGDRQAGPLSGLAWTHTF